MYPSLFGRLSQGFHRLTAAFDSNQARRRRKIAVPYIVFHALEMPDPLPGLGVQGQDGIGEKVVSEAVRAIEIGCGGARRSVNDAPLYIHGHPSPIVGRTYISPRVF